MKKLILLTFTVSIVVSVNAQWTTKSDIPGVGNNHPITFTIDGSGYSVTGYNTQNGTINASSYKYDPSDDRWSTLSIFPGDPRGFGMGGSYGDKGYVGFGLAQSGYLNDLWEYDPDNDSWRELTTCPCLGRRHPAFAVTENGKIYVGMGDGNDSTGTFASGFNDWWEYDIASDVWSRKADLPANGRHHPYFFAIGTDVYAGFGHNAATIYRDFYKYNSTNDQWTRLNDFPGESRVAGAQFAYNGYGYIVDGEGSDHQNLDSGEFYKYHPDNDEWTRLAFRTKEGLWAPNAFVIDSMAYVVGGDLDNDQSLNTLWAYSLEEKPVDNSLSEINDEGELTLNSDFFDQNATYQWVDCNDNYSPIGSANDPDITMENGSSYALVVTYSEGGIDTSDCYKFTKAQDTTDNTDTTVSTSQVLSVSDDNQFSIYPNPVVDYVNVVSTSSENYNYSILSFSGRVLQSGVISLQNQRLNMSSFSKGSYFLVINSENNETRNVYKIQKD